MIRNLNQVNFRGFGSVLPERAHSPFPFPKEAAQPVELDGSQARMYRAVSETWIGPSTGMSILSVRSTQGAYQHFYLDKPV